MATYHITRSRNPGHDRENLDAEANDIVEALQSIGFVPEQLASLELLIVSGPNGSIEIRKAKPRH